MPYTGCETPQDASLLPQGAITITSPKLSFPGVEALDKGRYVRSDIPSPCLTMLQHRHLNQALKSAPLTKMPTSHRASDPDPTLYIPEPGHRITVSLGGDFRSEPKSGDGKAERG